MKKRIAALALTLALIVSLLAVPAFAYAGDSTNNRQHLERDKTTSLNWVYGKKYWVEADFTVHVGVKWTESGSVNRDMSDDSGYHCGYTVLETAVNGSVATIRADRTVGDHWAAGRVTIHTNPVVVTYSTEHGTAPAQVTGKHVNDTLTLPGALSASGYKFKGWNFAGTTYAAGASVTLTKSATGANNDTFDYTQLPTANVTITAVWAPVYYIYNSATGKTTEVEGLNTVDLTGKVTGNYLYAGYTVNDKTFATMATASGKSLTPVQGNTYCIREISNAYLQPKTFLVNTGETLEAYLITAVDDPAKFASVGFNNTAASGYYDGFVFTNTYNQTTSYTFGTVFNGLSGGKLVMTQAADYNGTAGTSYTFTPYFITKDGVKVTNVSRTFVNSGTTTPASCTNSPAAGATAVTLAADAPVLRSAPFFMIAPPEMAPAEIEEAPVIEDAEVTETIETVTADTLTETAEIPEIPVIEEIAEEAQEESATEAAEAEEPAAEEAVEEIAEEAVQEEPAEEAAVEEQPAEEAVEEAPAEPAEEPAEPEFWMDDSQPVVLPPAPAAEEPAAAEPEAVSAPEAVEEPAAVEKAPAPAFAALIKPAKLIVRFFINRAGYSIMTIK